MNDARLPKIEFIREQSLDGVAELDYEYFKHIIGNKYFYELIEPFDFDINGHNSTFYGLWDIGA